MECCDCIKAVHKAAFQMYSEPESKPNNMCTLTFLSMLSMAVQS